MSDSSQPSIILGRRVFSSADQTLFAQASGDFNPMHVDEIAARRLIAGRQVVHGVHTLLQALDWCKPGDTLPLRGVQCSFDRPVSVGDQVEFAQSQDAQGRTVIRVSVDELVCTTVTLLWGAERVRGTGEGAAWVLARRVVQDLPAPLDEPPGSQAGQVFEVHAGSVASLQALFPGALRLLTPAVLGAVAELSYFVGMVCPGLHSVFSSLSFDLADPSASAGLAFKPERYDPRLKLFIVHFAGWIQGELRAFLRPPPRLQPGTATLFPHVQQHEFAGTRSLVVGGSRGLGEMTAKLLAAGGGDVVISYAQGRNDALDVARDIASAGRGRCEVLAIDMNNVVFDALPLTGALSAVYFFATPRIFRKKAGTFDAAQFGEFTRFYLERFSQLCLWLESRPGPGRVQVYLPSTVFLTERPRGMTEYTMAKAAAEVLADDLNRSLRRVRVIHTRLPRLATDQTASILGVSAQSNVEALLPVVRQVSQAAG